jgi:hypothetical protein
MAARKGAVGGRKPTMDLGQSVRGSPMTGNRRPTFPSTIKIRTQRSSPALTAVDPMTSCNQFYPRPSAYIRQRWSMALDDSAEPVTYQSQQRREHHSPDSRQYHAKPQIPGLSYRPLPVACSRTASDGILIITSTSDDSAGSKGVSRWVHHGCVGV